MAIVYSSNINICIRCNFFNEEETRCNRRECDNRTDKPVGLDDVPIVFNSSKVVSKDPQLAMLLDDPELSEVDRISLRLMEGELLPEQLNQEQCELLNTEIGKDWFYLYGFDKGGDFNMPRW